MEAHFICKAKHYCMVKYVIHNNIVLHNANFHTLTITTTPTTLHTLRLLNNQTRVLQNTNQQKIKTKNG